MIYKKKKYKVKKTRNGEKIYIAKQPEENIRDDNVAAGSLCEHRKVLSLSVASSFLCVLSH